MCPIRVIKLRTYVCGNCKLSHYYSLFVSVYPWNVTREFTTLSDYIGPTWSVKVYECHLNFKLSKILLPITLSAGGAKSHYHVPCRNLPTCKYNLLSYEVVNKIMSECKPLHDNNKTRTLKRAAVRISRRENLKIRNN